MIIRILVRVIWKPIRAFFKIKQISCQHRAWKILYTSIYLYLIILVGKAYRNRLSLNWRLIVTSGFSAETVESW